LLAKIDRLSDENLRQPQVPSGTTLLGMVKHLGYAHRWWFRMVFANEPVAVPWIDDDPANLHEYTLEVEIAMPSLLDYKFAQSHQAIHATGHVQRVPSGEVVDTRRYLVDARRKVGRQLDAPLLDHALARLPAPGWVEAILGRG
jgi:hypothetical protein